MPVRPYDTEDDIAHGMADDWAESFTRMLRLMGAPTLSCDAAWLGDDLYGFWIAGRRVVCNTGRVEDAKEVLLAEVIRDCGGEGAEWQDCPKRLARVCAWYRETYGESIEPILAHPEQWWGLFLEWADEEHRLQALQAETKAAVDALCDGIRDICKPSSGAA
jgi:hypothetical protein